MNFDLIARRTSDAETLRKEIQEAAKKLKGTYSARGIGAAIVRRFVDEGARVVFSDLLNEKGKALQADTRTALNDLG